MKTVITSYRYLILGSVMAIALIAGLGFSEGNSYELSDHDLSTVVVGQGPNCMKCTVRAYHCNVPGGISPNDGCYRLNQADCLPHKRVGWIYNSTCNADEFVSECVGGGPGDNCVSDTGGCGTYLEGKGCKWSGGQCANQGVPKNCDGSNC